MRLAKKKEEKAWTQENSEGGINLRFAPGGKDPNHTTADPKCGICSTIVTYNPIYYSSRPTTNLTFSVEARYFVVGSGATYLLTGVDSTGSKCNPFRKRPNQEFFAEPEPNRTEPNRTFVHII